MAVTAGVAAVGAAATIGGAAMSSDAAGDASAAQQKAAKQAANVQRDQYRQSRTDLAPYRTAGYSALNSLMGLSGISGGPQTTQGFVNYLRQEGGDNVNPIHLSTLQSYGVDDLAGLRKRIEGTGEGQVGEGMVFTGDTQGAFNSNERRGLLGYLDQYESMAGGAGAVPEGYSSGPILFPLDKLKEVTSMESFNKSPEMAAVNVMLDRGLQQRDRAAAATGNLRSGERLKALSDYTTGTALQGYGQFYGRRAGEVGLGYDSQVSERDKAVGRLQTLAGFGQNAVNTGAGLGAQYAQSAGNLALAGGQAQAAGAVGQANAWGGALNQIGGLAGNMYGQYQGQQNFNQLLTALQPRGNLNSYYNPNNPNPSAIY